MTLKLSKVELYLALALSIVLAVIDALNVTTFRFEQPWHDLILYGAPAIAAFGISPITSAKLDTLLHMSNRVVVGLTALLGTGVAVVQTFGWPTNTVGIVTGVLVLIGGVLFGTVVVIPTPTVPPPVPASARRRH